MTLFRICEFFFPINCVEFCSKCRIEHFPILEGVQTTICRIRDACNETYFMANKPKDWEWQIVAAKSIKSLFVAIAGYVL
jgi:hypothetical protein